MQRVQPSQLSRELRTYQSEELTRRRWMLGLQLVGVAAGSIVGLDPGDARGTRGARRVNQRAALRAIRASAAQVCGAERPPSRASERSRRARSSGWSTSCHDGRR